VRPHLDTPATRVYHFRVAKSADYSGVRFERDNHVARITLARPDQHNALNAEDVRVLRGILEDIENDAVVRVVVLTGEGEKTFCSGASLDQMETGEMSGRVFDTLTDRLAHLRVPTVCSLNGSVYGGGAELAICCDFRIGTPETRLSVPAAELGVCYPLGGLSRYVRRLGLPTASRILLSAEVMGSEELLRVGFLTHRVERDRLSEATQELVHRLAGLAPLAVQAMKRLLLAVARGSVDPDDAEQLIEACAASDDLVEGLLARRERRSPDFRGA